VRTIQGIYSRGEQSLSVYAGEIFCMFFLKFVAEKTEKWIALPGEWGMVLN